MLLKFFLTCLLFQYNNCLEETTPTSVVNNSSICHKYIPHTKVINVTVNETFVVNKRIWCMKLPPRCTKAEVQYRPITMQRTVSTIETVEECCAGYNSKNGTCIPVCIKACENGKCIAPEKCKCDDGYFGETCSICLKCGSKCPEGFYGMNCEHECNCFNNATCDSTTGFCNCSAGWRDEDCNTPCPKGYYGLNCSDRCDKNETVCDHVTGKNICRDGYVGNYCDKSCPEGQYGTNCDKSCSCKNDAVCNVGNGNCECRPGWKGENCEIPCEFGKFGVNCTEDCLCTKGSMCSPVDGQCRCLPGWKGLYCSEQCTYGYYGEHCAKPCNCLETNFICDHIEGCKCPNEFIGELCDVNINDKYESYTNEILYENNNTALYVVIGILVFIILAFVAVFVYYRRRKRPLEDILNVHYNHNSFACVAEERPLNNHQRVINNLGYGINESQRPNCSRNDEPESKLLVKNHNADTGNPMFERQESSPVYMNMMQISEETENTYEEIKMPRK